MPEAIVFDSTIAILNLVMQTYKVAPSKKLRHSGKSGQAGCGKFAPEDCCKDREEACGTIEEEFVEGIALICH